ncbi:MAG: SAM-dependent methyltransferase [Lautropia sp.]|nr:SAM-dependent methyltransferase [Lautropia sp.]
MNLPRFVSSFPQGSAGLPEPEAAALEASRRLAGRIADAIMASGGWLSFERYMEMALYEPELGYYSNPGRVFGSSGDFVTAPELTPLFGATVARQVSVWLREIAAAVQTSYQLDGHRLLAAQKEEHTAPCILEVGAGSGMLAAQLLNALSLRGHEGLRYLILDLSAERRQQQRQTLANRAPGLLDQVEWIDRLPDRFCGVVIGNEVLDAMPVRLFEWRQEAGGEVESGHDVVGNGNGNGNGMARSGGVADTSIVDATGGAGSVDAGRLFERGVRLGHLGFEWALRPADASLIEAVQHVMPTERAWPSPYRSEVCPAQPAWLGSIADVMSAGVILLLDYGFPAREYYHPQRAQGTLMCHYRHRSHTDPFLWPGLSDITAHVDYSALARAAQTLNLTPFGYVSQASFLLNAGVLDELADLPREPESFWFAQAQAVQMLLSEAEMGELFKVIALSKNLPQASDQGFASGNRVNRLV